MYREIETARQREATLAKVICIFNDKIPEILDNKVNLRE